MNGNETRTSNFELLRIFTMLMIVSSHAVCYVGELTPVTNS
jgi:hypothetical protein